MIKRSFRYIQQTLGISFCSMWRDGK